MWVMDQDSHLPASSPLQADIPAVLDEVLPESAGELARAMAAPNSNTVVQRFTSGRRCFAARVHDRIAAYCWVSQAAECISELEREFQIPPDEAYIWDCATLPDYQGKHLYTALLTYLAARLRSEGVQRIWIGSSLDNRPSVRAFARAGFQPVITMLYLRLSNLSCAVITGDPGASETLVAGVRQRLTSRDERAWGPLLLRTTRPVELPACAQS
jgi:ribosomal protein S18 acetylase RimI-like enzyme